MKVKDITTIDEFLYIILNDKKLLISNGNIYDVTKYNKIKKVIVLNNVIYLVDDKFNLINIKTGEITLNDSNIVNIEKYDNDTLIFTLNDELKQKVLYDINSKESLIIPFNYKLDSILPTNKYVLKNKENDNIIILDNNQNIILETSNCEVHSYSDKLILVYQNKINIVSDLNNQVIKDKYYLTTPIYHDGKIILIKRKSIKLYDLDFNLIKEIKINDLLKVNKTILFNNLLKITSDNGEKENNILVNIENDKIIKHEHIDNINSLYIGCEDNQYYFYNYNLDLIKSIKAFNYQILTDNLIKIKTYNGKQILNIKTGELIETKYENICFF